MGCAIMGVELRPGCLGSWRGREGKTAQERKNSSFSFFGAIHLPKQKYPPHSLTVTLLA